MNECTQICTEIEINCQWFYTRVDKFFDLDGEGCTIIICMILSELLLMVLETWNLLLEFQTDFRSIMT